MMRQMRENTKIIMLATAVAFVALMVFQWGMDISGRSLGTNELGRVNGAPVTYEAYNAAYRNLYDQIASSQEEPISSQQNKQIEDAAWDEVVNQILVQQELQRRGIAVTDDEVRQAARFSPPPEFRSNPAFQTDGSFDLDKYQQFLASPQIDEGLLLQLEAYYRDVIPRGKLLRQVSSGIYVTDSELWQAWRDENEQVRVRFVPLNPVQRIEDDAVEVTSAEIESYYQQNMEDEFAVPATARVKVAVLPKAPLASDSAAALTRAEEIRQEILDGADFEEVAQRESADPGSARQGGDLGWFTRGDMAPAVEEAAFDGRRGRVQEPVQTRFGYHIIRVDEKTADSVRARHILVQVERTEDSEIELLTLADSLETLDESLPLEEAAAEIGVSTREIDLNSNFPFIVGAGQAGEGADWVFEEEEVQPGDVSPVFENQQAFYALEVLSVEPAGFQSLEEARATITETLRFQKKMARVVEQGGQYLDEMRTQGLTVEDLAVKHGLEIRAPAPFTRTDFVPGLGRHNAAIGTAFGLQAGEISQVVETDQNAFIIHLLERMPADSAAWEAQKEDQRIRMANQIERQRLQQWLEGLRAMADIDDRREEVFQAQEDLGDQPFGAVPMF